MTVSKLSHGTPGCVSHLLNGDNTFCFSYLIGMVWGSTKISENSINPGKCTTDVRSYGECHLLRKRHSIK